MNNNEIQGQTNATAQGRAPVRKLRILQVTARYYPADGGY